MSYTAPEAGAFAKKKGSLSQKVCYELGLIDTEIESLGAGGEGASLADGKIWVGDGEGAAAAVTMSGDATLANTGVLTISDSHMKRVKTALSSGAANAFCLAWQNPEDHAIIVTRLIVDLTTAGGTDTAVLDFGPANDDTTHSDGLINGANANAIAIYDNIEDQGTNGQSVCKLDAAGGTTDYITGQILTEAANSLVGNAYIFYTAV